MSERLEPGRLVRWQHEGGWKVGRVLHAYGGPHDDGESGYDDSGGYYGGRYVVQCEEASYLVDADDTEPHQTRKERGEE